MNAYRTFVTLVALLCAAGCVAQPGESVEAESDETVTSGSSAATASEEPLRDWEPVQGHNVQVLVDGWTVTGLRSASLSQGAQGTTLVLRRGHHDSADILAVWARSCRDGKTDAMRKDITVRDMADSGADSPTWTLSSARIHRFEPAASTASTEEIEFVAEGIRLQ